MASHGRRHAKRTDPRDALSGSSPPHRNWRDWASLTAGTAGLVAERALANDVADYIRCRATCSAWRACSEDPRASSVSDCRFHPPQWIMLPGASKDASNPRQRFLNIYTGECVHVRLPDAIDHCLMGRTAEGLLVLNRTNAVQLLNPLTGQLTDFPHATELHSVETCSGGLADSGLAISDWKLVVAKPGDKNWTRLLARGDPSGRIFLLLALSFAGRMYCITTRKILVVETAANKKPRFVVVADLKMEPALSFTYDYLYPVYDEVGGLILVHRRTTDNGGSCLDDTYAAYQVILDTGNVKSIRDLGGQALFVCGSRSQSVAAKIYSSIRADTIYLCSRVRDRVVAFDLSGKGTILDKTDVPNDLFNLVCS